MDVLLVGEIAVAKRPEIGGWGHHLRFPRFSARLDRRLSVRTARFSLARANLIYSTSQLANEPFSDRGCHEHLKDHHP